MRVFDLSDKHLSTSSIIHSFEYCQYRSSLNFEKKVHLHIIHRLRQIFLPHFAFGHRTFALN